MSDKDVKTEEENMVSDPSDSTDEYEKVCIMCHRPESKAGKMIDLPNNLTICHECMQKSMDTMMKGSFDYSKLMNIPGVQILNMTDLENMVPKQQ